jgi:hypothetical protein
MRSTGFVAPLCVEGAIKIGVRTTRLLETIKNLLLGSQSRILLAA